MTLCDIVGEQVDCNNAILEVPGYVKPLIKRGRLYHELEQYDKAIEDFAEAYEMQGDEPEDELFALIHAAQTERADKEAKAHIAARTYAPFHEWFGNRS